MSNFSTEYNRVKSNINSAFDTIESRGGAATAQSNRTSSNLSAQINTIPTGIEIQGTLLEGTAKTNIVAGNTYRYEEIYHSDMISSINLTYPSKTMAFLCVLTNNKYVVFWNDRKSMCCII